MAFCRNPQHEDLSFVGRMTINTASCKSFKLSQNNGLDTICCSICSSIRILLYKKYISFIEGNTELFQKILDKYPFIQHIKVLCGSNRLIVYQIKHQDTEIGLLEKKLKEQFLYWKSLGICQKEISPSQVCYTKYFYPVIIPNHNTKVFKRALNVDSGVKIEKDVLSVVDLEKAFESGEYMYVINYYQVLSLIQMMEYEVGEPMKLF
jgi:hypothetical protein